MPTSPHSVTRSVGSQLCDLPGVRAVADHDGRLDRDQHAERGDHADQRAGTAQRSHDHPVRQRAEERRPARRRRPPTSRNGQPCSYLQLPLHEDAGDRRGAEREVQHAGAAVDDDQALRRERVQRADAQAEQRESDDLVHRPPLAGPPTLRSETSEQSARSDRIASAPARRHRSAATRIGADPQQARLTGSAGLALRSASRHDRGNISASEHPMCCGICRHAERVVRPRYLSMGEHDVHFERSAFAATSAVVATSVRAARRRRSGRRCVRQR